MTKQIINKIMIIKTLMVGDLVSDGCNAVKVKAIMGDMINAFNGTELCGYFPDAVRPIPLNGEMLEHFGFRNFFSEDYILERPDYKVLILCCNDKAGYFSIHKGDINVLGVPLSYLHELQNYMYLFAECSLDIDNLIGKQL